MPRFSSVKPGMFESLANPEIDAVSKGCFNDPVLFHIKCRYENTIIIIAVTRYDMIFTSNYSDYIAWRTHDTLIVSCDEISRKSLKLDRYSLILYFLNSDRLSVST